MTEMSDRSISEVEQRFILHWGEMGARWGINRTVAQIHALLYLSPRPMHAEEIAATLAVARSNVSNSLRELQGWGLVKIAHVLGDRRDHFESLKDIWKMFDIVVAERKRREVDPTVEFLQELDSRAAGTPYTKARVKEMLQFFESMTGFYQEMQRLPSGALPALVKLRGKIRKLLAGGKQ
jgi:DNA-binding transcriptional regulator GbsR (MarR family)